MSAQLPHVRTEEYVQMVLMATHVPAQKAMKETTARTVSNSAIDRWLTAKGLHIERGYTLK